jgi:phosphoribosyl-ATP pyrophosphohydrolase
VLEDLYELIQGRKREMPEGSYTTHLFSEGISKIKKKTGEEAVELLLAGSRREVVYETADLFYHLLVMLVEMEIGLDEIFEELESR